MSEPHVQFSAATLKLLKRLDDAPRGLKVALARGVDLENNLTIAHIQQRYLSQRGPETLGVVTSRLWKSLWASKARVVGGMLVASIGSNVRYAGVHEYGFDGPVQVRGFTRRARGNDQFAKVSVSAVFDPATGRVERRAHTRKADKRIASGIQFVRAHTRHAHYAERRPIRRGIADRISAYSVALERAALDYLKGGAS